MPILANAKKALRASNRKAVYNKKVKSMVKTMTDKMEKDPNPDNLKAAFSAVDKAVKRNLFHKNKAARLKSQLSKLMTKEKPATKTKKAVAPKKTSGKKATTKKSTKKIATKKTATSKTKKVAKKAAAKKTK
jgi:small subunit ribosomal protein S20